jgi:hypothetical protein
LDLKHLPWLLPELSIDVIGFLPVPYPNPIEVEHKDQAMASPTKAILPSEGCGSSSIWSTITQMSLDLLLLKQLTMGVYKI